MGGSRPVVVIDGECGLCNAFARWIIRRDTRGLFVFATQDSKFWAAAPVRDREACRDTVVLVDGGTVLVRSSAALKVLVRLGSWPGVLGRIGLLAPRRWRDRVYDFVAARRRKSVCAPLEPDIRGRFLE